jgi:Protein of unknown function (DUF2934)
MIGFILLNDPASERQWIIRGEHVSAAEARREDGLVTLSLLNGEKILLTQEESRQFVQHTHPHHGLGTERIRELAHRKWEQAGRPPGDGKSFWHEAEHELLRISRLVRSDREGGSGAAGASPANGAAASRSPNFEKASTKTRG